MANPPAGYSVGRGAYFTDDGQGPYTWDGANMRPLGQAARLHGDVRALLLATGTKASVHNASAVVSNAAGRLFGFFIVDPGTSPTITVYDNASAASGRVLRTVSSSEVAKGAWIYCGPDGIDALNGIYVALGGTAAPTVAMVFEGTVPAETHAGTEMWFDGTAGSDSNDGLSIGAPRRTLSRLSGDFDTGSWRLYFKRGTTVVLPATASHDVAGTDILLRDYGDEASSAPVIQLEETSIVRNVGVTTAGSGYTSGTHSGLAMQGGTGTGLTCNITVSGGAVTGVVVASGGTGYSPSDVLTCSGIPGGGSGFVGSITAFNAGYFAVTATSGVAEFKNLQFNALRRTVNTAVDAARGTKLVADSCTVTGPWQNGLQFGGVGARMTRCSVDAQVGSALYGGTTGFAAPSRALIFQCTAAASADAYTLHNGNTTGTGNCAIANTLTAGTENCIDYTNGEVGGFFTYSLAAFNRLYQGTIQAISLDTQATHSIFVGNIVTPSGTGYALGLYRGTGNVLVGNYMECGNVNNGGNGTVLSIDNSCTSMLILNNTLVSNSQFRAAIHFANNTTAGSGGVFKNNIVINAGSGSTARTMNVYNLTVAAAWTIDWNHYYPYNATPGRFNDGTTDHTTFAAWQAAATGFDDNGSGGQSAGNNPNLTADYKLPSGSFLTGKGQSQSPVCYLGLNGVFWQYGQPSVGAAQG